MKPLLRSIKPANGYGHFFHMGLVALLPIAVFVLVRIPLVLPALVVVLLGKWRIFAVRPRFWPAIIRANSVDIIVGISILTFMVHNGNVLWQAVWAVLYGIWLLAIKPKTGSGMVSVQAALGLLAGLMALFVAGGTWPLYALVTAAGLICYFAAHHFFDSYAEPYTRMLSYIWAYFGAALTWVLSHMLIVYPRHSGLVAQPTLLLCVIGYGLAALYYFDHHNRLTTLVKREFVFVTLAIVLILIASLFYESTHLTI